MDRRSRSCATLAEGQRRYVECLSAYARQFLERTEKPDVDKILGIAPPIAIRRENTTRNPRSNRNRYLTTHSITISNYNPIPLNKRLSASGLALWGACSLLSIRIAARTSESQTGTQRVSFSG